MNDYAEISFTNHLQEIGLQHALIVILREFTTEESIDQVSYKRFFFTSRRIRMTDHSYDLLFNIGLHGVIKHNYSELENKLKLS